MLGSPPITERQREVARLVADGYTNERIAQELGISHDGAKYHVSELLSRLGVERREEIAAWYHERREGASLRTRLRSLLGAPLAWGAGGAAVVAAVVVLGVGALLGGDGGFAEFGPSGEVMLPALETEEPPPVAEYLHEHSGDGWESRAAANLGERDLLILVDWPAATYLFDRSVEQVVGEVAHRGYPTLVAHARTTGKLIVSHSSPGPTGESHKPQYSFLVFDIHDGLSLQEEILLPDFFASGGISTAGGRVHEHGTMILSADERYLYYVAISEEAMDSGNRSPDVIGIVDLEGEERLLPPAQALDGCGEPALYPADSSSVLVRCFRVGPLRLLDPQGRVSPDIDAGGLAGFYHREGDALVVRSEESQVPVSISVAFVTEDGVGVVYLDGSYASADQSGAAIAGRVLPEGRSYYLPWYGDVLALDATHVVLPYYGGTPPSVEPEAAGFVIVDTATGDIERDIEIEHHGSYPLNEREIALVGDGRLDILDLTTMHVVQSFITAHPDRPEALPAVR